MLFDLIGELVLKPLVEGLCCFTGTAIVGVVSLGRLRVADPEPSRRRGKAVPDRSRGSWTYVQGGRRYVSTDTAKLLGILFWAATIVFLVALLSSP